MWSRCCGHCGSNRRRTIWAVLGNVQISSGSPVYFLAPCLKHPSHGFVQLLPFLHASASSVRPVGQSLHDAKNMNLTRAGRPFVFAFLYLKSDCWHARSRTHKITHCRFSPDQCAFAFWSFDAAGNDFNSTKYVQSFEHDIVGMAVQ